MMLLGAKIEMLDHLNIVDHKKAESDRKGNITDLHLLD